MIGGHVVLLFGFFSGAAIFFSVKIAFWIDLVAFPILLFGYTVFRLMQSKRSLVDLFRVLIAFGILGFTYYINQVEPYDLQVRHIEIIDDRFEEELTIIHITDIQSNDIGEYEASVFDTIAAHQPDLLIHTGDLVQMHSLPEQEAELRELAKLFRGLDVPHGIYNVIGDTDIDALLESMKFDDLAGLTTLVDEASAPIKLKSSPNVRIVGLSLTGSRFEDEYLGPVSERIDKDEFNILIGHAPDFAFNYTVSDFDLCLAGHTHGGQVRLPWIGPVITMSNIPRKHAYGFHEVSGTWLNVSSGVGAEHASKLPSIRLNCPPEIVVIHIKPS